jgi:hypothetical protein
MTTTVRPPDTAAMLRITCEPDQADVHPPATRARDLLKLAGRIAADTDPTRPVELAPNERPIVAMALPHLEDDAFQRVADIVAELHEAELAGQVDHREAGYVDPETHRGCAANLARRAVEADIKAGAA